MQQEPGQQWTEGAEGAEERAEGQKIQDLKQMLRRVEGAEWAEGTRLKGVQKLLKFRTRLMNSLSTQLFGYKKATTRDQAQVPNPRP